MKRIIMFFFVFTSLLFSSNDFIASNGQISFRYNDVYNKITKINGSMKESGIDIESINIGVYYKGSHYLLSDYVISKKYVLKSNMIEVISKLPFGEVKTTYIPSMLERYSLYILNEYQLLSKEDEIEFLYLFNMSQKNGIIKHVKNGDYYKYNENIYIKNLKNYMAGYIIPESSLEEVKLKKVEDEMIKYIDQKFILSSKMRTFDAEKSDVLKIQYKKEPIFLGFEKSKNIKDNEKEFWKEWLKPLPDSLDESTKQIVERFLIYLKTSTDGKNYFTNIGLKETRNKGAQLESAITFVRYGYYKEAKKLFEEMLNKEKEFSYLKKSELTLQEVKENYGYLMYLQRFVDTEFYSKNIGTILKRIERNVEMINIDMNESNPLEKGNEFEVYYYTYSLLELYEEFIGNNKYREEKLLLENYILKNFVTNEGIKKYRLDNEVSYLKWEYLLSNKDGNLEYIVEGLYKNTIFRRYPYFSSSKIIDIGENIRILKGFYLNNLGRYGDINLMELNESIIEGGVKIPNKIYLNEGKKYNFRGIDIYLVSMYLEMIYSRSIKR